MSTPDVSDAPVAEEVETSVPQAEVTPAEPVAAGEAKEEVTPAVEKPAGTDSSVTAGHADPAPEPLSAPSQCAPYRRARLLPSIFASGTSPLFPSQCAL